MYSPDMTEQQELYDNNPSLLRQHAKALVEGAKAIRIRNYERTQALIRQARSLDFGMGFILEIIQDTKVEWGVD